MSASIRERWAPRRYSLPHVRQLFEEGDSYNTFLLALSIKSMRSSIETAMPMITTLTRAEQIDATFAMITGKR
jgi:hypothetical protein